MIGLFPSQSLVPCYLSSVFISSSWNIHVCVPATCPAKMILICMLRVWRMHQSIEYNINYQHQVIPLPIAYTVSVHCIIHNLGLWREGYLFQPMRELGFYLRPNQRPGSWLFLDSCYIIALSTYHIWAWISLHQPLVIIYWSKDFVREGYRLDFPKLLSFFFKINLGLNFVCLWNEYIVSPNNHHIF